MIEGVKAVKQNSETLLSEFCFTNVIRIYYQLLNDIDSMILWKRIRFASSIIL
jgi:hypothetical protein